VGDAGPCNYVYSDEITHVTVAGMPTNSADYQCDSNNDSTVDDADGGLNAILGQLSAFIDVNAELAGAIDDGSLLLLPEFVGYSGGDATGMTTNMLLGSDISTQPDPTCGFGTKLNDTCDWDIDPDTIEAQSNPNESNKDCSVSGGQLDCGPSDFAFQLPLGGLNLDLTINQGRLNGTIGTGATLTSGRLCGSVPKKSITDAVDAACAADPPPEFCAIGAGLIPIIISCDPCTIVLSLEGVATGAVQTGE
jgi:hypothetical protein